MSHLSRSTFEWECDNSTKIMTAESMKTKLWTHAQADLNSSWVHHWSSWLFRHVAGSFVQIQFFRIAY